MRCSRLSGALKSWLCLAALSTILAAPGCAPARKGSPPGGSSQGAAGSSSELASKTAFTARARIEASGQARRLKLRFHTETPDRFRLEARGPVGGIGLIATGREGRVRIILPSRRRFTEGTYDDDLGSDLIGLPLSGCDLARVIRIASGVRGFQPCADADEAGNDGTLGATDRPGSIVMTSPSGTETLRIAFDWSESGSFPREVRLEVADESGATVSLTEFHGFDDSGKRTEDFFWEPVPAGSTQVSLGALALEESP